MSVLLIKVDVQGRPGLPELHRRSLPSIIYFQNLEDYKQSWMGVHFWKPNGIASDISAKNTSLWEEHGCISKN